MLSPSTWPGWFRGVLVGVAFLALFLPHIGWLLALAIAAAAIVSFRASAALRHDDDALRAELLGVAVGNPSSTVEVEVEHPFEVYATAYHQESIGAVVDARLALAEQGEPLFAALELEPNNPFDADAVRVELLLFLGSHKVGYLPPGLSREWAAQLRPHTLDAQQVVVAATILGSGSRADPWRVRLG
ncbi:hypothetical protein [Subtercola boreus]|uniref:HIRAN domain-containing protein n=1 Tax=Subtercola boreus TaxID=120213 RepID=A0A3E0W7P2_9MICO|nr:hypothetical protein [Subtercola boreus]RFA17923.1 hypothetical protein B7R24_14740 [Subtercola boreus]RFA18305.1 hypothetical protein B7R23_14775 [Subtercola boreus]RFA24835.1 hypothetical protein B7R25_14770 [Subtercola boreus]